jgi:L-asparaginase
MKKKKLSILIIYTGGTIGMVHDPGTGALKPINFEHISEQVPELNRFDCHLSSFTFNPVIDSSKIRPLDWVELVNVIKKNYQAFDGFVVLHGTDTMAYSASAVSFMLENLRKPVIFTGSQLPIGTLRTDGKENLITAIEIAATRKGEEPAVPEVCIYFENRLFRGNRTTKRNAEHFNAFHSPNYPVLAESGIQIKFNYAAIHSPDHDEPLKVYTQLCEDVAVIKIYPGISGKQIESVCRIPGLKAIVLETFGTGNAPVVSEFLDPIRSFIEKGGIVLNVSQCPEGKVEMDRYETGLVLQESGVMSGHDITFEAAITKLMMLLGQPLNREELIMFLNYSIRGEIL